MRVLGGGEDVPGNLGTVVDPTASAQAMQRFVASGGHLPPGVEGADDWEMVKTSEAQIIETITAIVADGFTQLGGQISALNAGRPSAPATTSKARLMMLGAAGFTILAGTVYGIYRLVEYAINETVARLSFAYDNSFQNQLGNKTIVNYLDGPGKHPANDLREIGYTQPTVSDPSEQRALRLIERDKKREAKDGL